MYQEDWVSRIRWSIIKLNNIDETWTDGKDNIKHLYYMNIRIIVGKLLLC